MKQKLKALTDDKSNNDWLGIVILQEDISSVIYLMATSHVHITVILDALDRHQV